MKIYVACHDQFEGNKVANTLRESGHEITSTWLGLEFKPTDQYAKDERPDIALVDHDEVCASDALVLIAGPDKYPGGKFVETGIALGRGVRVFVVGRRENMLLWLPRIEQVDSIDDLVTKLKLEDIRNEAMESVFAESASCGYY